MSLPDTRAGARPTGRHRMAAGLLLLAVLPGCTLCKPIVGAVTGPFILAAHSTSLHGCNDGCAAAAALCVMSAAGAVGGLITGILSDVHWFRGAAPSPTDNWYDPFRTNLDSR